MRVREADPNPLKDRRRPAEKKRMYMRLRTFQRLGLLGPLLRLHRKLDGREFFDHGPRPQPRSVVDRSRSRFSGWTGDSGVPPTGANKNAYACR